MPEEISNRERVNRRSGLWISLAVGLVLLAGLMALGGWSKNSANGNTSDAARGGAAAKPEARPGTGVENNRGGGCAGGGGGEGGAKSGNGREEQQRDGVRVCPGW